MNDKRVYPEIGRVADTSATGKGKSEQRFVSHKRSIAIIIIAVFAVCFTLLVITSGHPTTTQTPTEQCTHIPEFSNALVPVMGTLAIAIVIFGAVRKDR